MIEQASDIFIERPVEQVFAFLADLRRFAEWQTEAYRSEVLTPGPIGVGTRFTEVLKMGGKEVEAVCEVTDYEAGRLIAWKGSAPGLMDYSGRMAFEAADGGTVVHYSGSTQLRGLWKLASPLMAGEMKREMENGNRKIKEVVEAA